MVLGIFLLALSLIEDGISIPMDIMANRKIWIHSSFGNLTLKDAYSFKSTTSSTKHWFKHIWNVDIPPSNVFIVERLWHNRFPTDDNLMLKGNITAKMVNSSMHEFTITKDFNVDLHPHKASMIIEVFWLCSAIGWLKCNAYVSFSSDWASCGAHNSFGGLCFWFC
ncbi:hypothetical protein KIW84_021062 [Lathyrus oleraceus]|uniref:Reverse transcriptase zinc-binding domain-containing protein n=1 Tax=Pisum sativum TaxID=3888 RepID=A0A9D4Y7D1_PEA|nr:hypothetical protein KIW84_021062 [Pisum sativum]